jgi:hypothetical protein
LGMRPAPAPLRRCVRLVEVLRRRSRSGATAGSVLVANAAAAAASDWRGRQIAPNSRVADWRDIDNAAFPAPSRLNPSRPDNPDLDRAPRKCPSQLVADAQTPRFVAVDTAQA